MKLSQVLYASVRKSQKEAYTRYLSRLLFYHFTEEPPTGIIDVIAPIGSKHLSFRCTLNDNGYCALWYDNMIIYECFSQIDSFSSWDEYLLRASRDIVYLFFDTLFYNQPSENIRESSKRFTAWKIIQHQVMIRYRTFDYYDIR